MRRLFLNIVIVCDSLAYAQYVPSNSQTVMTLVLYGRMGNEN